MPLPASELRALVEAYLDELALTPELGSLAGPMRHAVGGKLVRPVLCLATGAISLWEAAGFIRVQATSGRGTAHTPLRHVPRGR